MIGISADHFIKAAIKLRDLHQVTPSFWSAGPTIINRLRAEFPQTVVMNSYDLCCADIKAFSKLVGINHLNQDVLSPSYQAALADGKLFVLENLLHRSDPGSHYCLEEMRTIVNDYFVIAHNLIEHYKPKLIVFEVAPHTMYDLAIYHLAKHLKIETMFLDDTHIPAFSFVCMGLLEDRSYFDIPTSEKVGEAEKIDIFRNFISAQSAIRPFYMTKLIYSRNYYQVARQFLGQVFQSCKQIFESRYHVNDPAVVRHRISYEKVKGYLLSEKAGNFSSTLKQFFIYLKLERLYKKLSRDFALSGKQKYIYVPLSLQHERTTLPSAGFMYNQVAYIRLLASCLPDGIKLYVKENPKQFSYYTGIPARSESFYKELRDLGVVFCPLDFDSHTLIKESLAVAVTTGSAGFEAIVGHRKPVISFATSWYSHLPGVHSISRVRDLEQFYAKLTKRELSVDEDELQSSLARTEKAAFYLWPEGATILSKNWNMDLMAENLYRIFARLLNLHMPKP